MLRFPASAFALAFALASVAAQDANNKKAPPRTVSIVQPKITLSAALAHLARQTGVRVADDTERGDEPIALKLKGATFWEALDAIATAAGAKVALSAGDKPLSLIPAGPDDQAPPTSYSGDFRVQLSEIAARRRLDARRSSLQLTLEVAWAPALKPLFIDTQVRDVRAADADGNPLKVAPDGGALAAIDGRASTTLELALPGVPRAVQELARVEGKLLVVAPSKMLTFRFDADLKALQAALPGGALRRMVQEDVTCQVAKVVTEKDRWSVQIALNYPAGGRTLESFQAGSLVANNELVLVGRDGKRRLTRSGYVIDAVSARRALVTYHFRDAPARRLGAPADWRPVYTAPAKIVDVEVPFAFKKVPLP